MHEIDLKNYSVRSDLVVDMLSSFEDKSGVVEHEEVVSGIQITDVSLEKENSLNRKAGRYITIAFSDVTDSSNRKKVEEVFVHYLKDLLKDEDLLGKKCLVVGLGNIESTPDSLGPKVASNILVTRYLFEMDGVEVDSSYSSVSSIVPGVSGTTGIESGDIILGVVRETKPDFILAIDALASSSIDRINKTIQMTNTGIHPGSGVGNKRKEVSIDTIGIPVIAIGVPTVIDGVTIVFDTIQYMFQQFSYNKEVMKSDASKLVPVSSRNYLEHEENLTSEEKEKLLGMVGTLSDEEIKQLIFEVLTPVGYNLMVTVKEVDFVTECLVKLLTSGIDHTLHKNIIQ